jgi:hypothetical protein
MYLNINQSQTHLCEDELSYLGCCFRATDIDSYVAFCIGCNKNDFFNRRRV